MIILGNFSPHNEKSPVETQYYVNLIRVSNPRDPLEQEPVQDVDPSVGMAPHFDLLPLDSLGTTPGAGQHGHMPGSAQHPQWQ